MTESYDKPSRTGRRQKRGWDRRPKKSPRELAGRRGDTTTIAAIREVRHSDAGRQPGASVGGRHDRRI